jgi:hypothetical protein
MTGLILPPGAIVEHGPGVAPPGLQDTLLGESVVGGPLAAQDVRMFLDRRTLEHLLDVASASTVGRAVLHGVGVRVRVYQGGDGHRYSVWSLVSHPPQAERAAFGPAERRR